MTSDDAVAVAVVADAVDATTDAVVNVAVCFYISYSV